MALVDISPATYVAARYEETSTTALLTPGSVSIDNMGGHWEYVKASAAVAQYALVTISNALIPLAAEATTTSIAAAPQKLGIAQVAFASADFGWVWRGPGGGVGRGIKCKLAASCALDVLLCTTATAGVVDDAIVDESVVAGLKSTATITTAAAAEVIATTFLTCNLGEVD